MVASLEDLQPMATMAEPLRWAQATRGASVGGP